MKFRFLRFSGLVMLLTISLPALWWRMAHGWFGEGNEGNTKTNIVLIWTVVNIALVCFEPKQK